MRPTMLTILLGAALPGCVGPERPPLMPSVQVWDPAPLPVDPRGVLAVRTLGRGVTGDEDAPFHGYAVLDRAGREVHAVSGLWSPAEQVRLAPGDYVVVSETVNPTRFSWAAAYAYVRVEVRGGAVTWVDFNGPEE